LEPCNLKHALALYIQHMCINTASSPRPPLPVSKFNRQLALINFIRAEKI